ncbi:MAG TPA: hypothetical protein VFV68_17110 [Agriterribacter sp.]|nr:hypothetical protein [Agriterribacter sp.]
MKILGIVLIAGGILMLIFRGFSFTEEKNIIDAGPIELNSKEKKNVSWPMYAGGIAVAAGVVVLLASRKKI